MLGDEQISQSLDDVNNLPKMWMMKEKIFPKAEWGRKSSQRLDDERKSSQWLNDETNLTKG